MGLDDIIEIGGCFPSGHFANTASLIACVRTHEYIKVPALERMLA